MKRFRKFLFFSIALILLLVLICGIYLSDYYRAAPLALEAMASDESITVETHGNLTVFSPALPETGFIFYPGAKVEYTAYAPLMKALAEENILCILVKMPGNMSVLNSQAGASIPQQFPEIDRWYIGGHSLGGTMAGVCLADNQTLFDGLILAASYITEDLSGSSVPVLSLLGSNDLILNQENYDKYLTCLPEFTFEFIIRGGNHSGFGAYGLQEGDGEAEISQAEQISITVDQILSFINS